MLKLQKLPIIPIINGICKKIYDSVDYHLKNGVFGEIVNGIYQKNMRFR